MGMPNDSQKAETTLVPVFRCKAVNCNAWIREEMAQSPAPLCPLCQSPMIRSMKHLPKLVKKIPRKKKEADQMY
ncbi:MAG: hypothetical protein K0R57_813 [Paenibacillaceae bacterium]|jgi:hypothetical protein|nr:hypothetical protein [Paenibacillaceae bacterium]